MITIIKFRPWNQLTDSAHELIEGWITAHDVHEARREADARGWRDLAEDLYFYEFPKPGRHKTQKGYTMLVD